MDTHPLIVSNPAILAGKPVLRGTRIPVHVVLKRLAHGETLAELLLDLPGLTEAGVQASLAYAAATLDGSEVLPLAISA